MDFPACIQSPSIDDIAKLTGILSDAGIPSALWGVNAAACHGGGLCPLDIELVINDIDQAKTFQTLCSYGCLPSQPSTDESAPCPKDFETWRELALHHQYHDRRHVRLNTPIYELPPTGDALSDFLRPFVIVYSVEMVGLPKVPPLSEIKDPNSSEKGELDQRDYVRVSHLPHCILGSDESKSSLLAPGIRRLIQSEIHVILKHANRPAVWGQHMAQLSEVIRSPGCGKGFESFHEIVKPPQVKFAHWLQAHAEGNSSQEALQCIRDEYRNAGCDGPTT
ncbi:hypothetical protein AnigIFM60653_002074 [Aspergillus niger]|nr:hypothetical protein AnigIFM50267_009606 [Aspergillus niger]GLA02595.1 hypothetical protein AnigIFM60653_002074 [Aspergillus niger]